MTAMNLLFIGLLAKVLDSVKEQAPLGYQDEGGFHYGVNKSAH